MATFPALSTGAVTQYPLPMTTGQAVQVIRYLDGADQRYLIQGRTFRSWQIKLDLLNESEIQQIEAFFASQQGDFATFVFPDPYSGANVPNCRLAAPSLMTEYVEADTCSTSFWVIETNG